jgi:hypothetical protein
MRAGRDLLALGAALAILAATAGGAPAGESIDRLERFRVLAASRLGGAQLLDGDTPLAELYALLDEEIVESLDSGGVFASLGFLQDRLDGLAEVWGGASLKLTRVGELTVGAFHLGAKEGSLRVYGRSADEVQLVAAVNREGRPGVHPLPSGPDGAAQFLVTWDGPPTGRGSRAFRLDLVRERGADVVTAWTTATLFPEGLEARDWRVRGGEVRVRYELRYPGWVPGCGGQTEQEDVYRVSAGGTGLTRVSRRQHDAWHLALRRAVSALLEALAGAERAPIAALVPDERLRQRLPASLRAEPACDAAEGSPPSRVSVAASAGTGVPWALLWEQAGGRWRLRAATPVLQ